MNASLSCPFLVNAADRSSAVISPASRLGASSKERQMVFKLRSKQFPVPGRCRPESSRRFVEEPSRQFVPTGLKGIGNIFQEHEPERYVLIRGGVHHVGPKFVGRRPERFLMSSIIVRRALDKNFLNGVKVRARQCNIALPFAPPNVARSTSF